MTAYKDKEGLFAEHMTAVWERPSIVREYVNAEGICTVTPS